MKILFRLVVITVLLALVIFTTTNAFFGQDGELPGNKEIIVLLHGLGRNTMSMWLLASRLEEAGYYVQRVGYSSLHHNPDEILEDVSATRWF